MACQKDVGEELVSCPYNNLHQVLRKHFQKHLLKCRLSYPDAALQKCPFNSSHLIPEHEFPIHLTNCPDRALLTKYKFSVEIPGASSAVITPQPKIVDDDDENWDNDEVCSSYNANKYVTAVPIIRSNIGSVPSKRKEFTKNEIERHEKIIKPEIKKET